METIQYPTPTMANKDHKCSYCDCVIPKGSTYEKSTHKFDGALYVWKSHENCSNIASKLDMYYCADDGVTGEYFKECISEAYDHIMRVDYPDGEGEPNVPKWADRLAFVINYYLTPTP